MPVDRPWVFLSQTAKEGLLVMPLTQSTATFTGPLKTTTRINNIF